MGIVTSTAAAEPVPWMREYLFVCLDKSKKAPVPWVYRAEGFQGVRSAPSGFERTLFFQITELVSVGICIYILR